MHSILLGFALLAADAGESPSAAPGATEITTDTAPRTETEAAPAATVAPAKDDLFPGARRVTTSAATGLPFLGIAEVGVGLGDGFAVGAIAGVTPSVHAFGLRPRVRVRATERTSFVLSSPMLFYPAASAPGPFGLGRTTWVLARAELFVDHAIGERWHAAGGMGV